MKNLFSIGILFLFCLFVASCTHERIYTNAESFDRKDFKSKQLQGKTMEFNEPIMRPTCLLLHDSLLITCNQGSEKIFHTFNLQTKKKNRRMRNRWTRPFGNAYAFLYCSKRFYKDF